MVADFKTDKRFDGITSFEKKIWLSTPTMHGDEQKWVVDAIERNWVSTVGENINEVEQYFRALDMAEETVAKAFAIGCTLNKTWDICN